MIGPRKLAVYFSRVPGRVVEVAVSNNQKPSAQRLAHICRLRNAMLRQPSLTHALFLALLGVPGGFGLARSRFDTCKPTTGAFLSEGHSCVLPIYHKLWRAYEPAAGAFLSAAKTVPVSQALNFRNTMFRHGYDRPHNNETCQ